MVQLADAPAVIFAWAFGVQIPVAAVWEAAAADLAAVCLFKPV